MVANKRTEGKDEKSRGLRVPMAIMTITRPEAMLNVNSTSNNQAGKGKINIDMINSTKPGMLKPDRLN